MNIRNARTDEGDILTDIAVRSEAYWGYDEIYMENFKFVYKVTEEFISRNPTFLMQEDNRPIGFYGIVIEKVMPSLEYFFIEPQYIGQGCGRLLWSHSIEYCKTIGISEFDIITSPQAKDFYVKMGAVPSGEVESLLRKGRMIPRLIYTL